MQQHFEERLPRFSLSTVSHVHSTFLSGFLFLSFMVSERGSGWASFSVVTVLDGVAAAPPLTAVADDSAMSVDASVCGPGRR